MLYAVFCYNQEDVTANWSKEEDDKVMRDLAAVQRKYGDAGKLGRWPACCRPRRQPPCVIAPAKPS